MADSNKVNEASQGAAKLHEDPETGEKVSKTERK